MMRCQRSVANLTLLADVIPVSRSILVFAMKLAGNSVNKWKPINAIEKITELT